MFIMIINHYHQESRSWCWDDDCNCQQASLTSAPELTRPPSASRQYTNYSHQKNKNYVFLTSFGPGPNGKTIMNPRGSIHGHQLLPNWLTHDLYPTPFLHKICDLKQSIFFGGRSFQCIRSMYQHMVGFVYQPYPISAMVSLCKRTTL